MNKKERMAMAMQLKEADRVPVMCAPSTGHLILNTSVDPVEHCLTIEGSARSLLELAQKYDFDGIVVSVGHERDPDKEKRVKEIKNEDGNKVIYWKSGEKTICPPDDVPYFAPISNIKEQYKINEIDVANINCDEGNFFVLDKLISEAGDEYSIHGEVTSPFSSFIYYFSIPQQALMALIDNPLKCKEMIQKFADCSVKRTIKLIERKVDAIVISSAWAGSSLISLLFYKDFVLPYESQIAAIGREHEIPIYTHTCGFISDRLELMVESGIQGIECLDPPPLGNVKLDDAKKRIGHKVFIKGNIDSTTTLLNGTKEEIIEDAKWRVSVAAPGGGYILSTACSIAPHVPPENVVILSEVTQRYGRYIHPAFPI